MFIRIVAFSSVRLGRFLACCSSTCCPTVASLLLPAITVTLMLCAGWLSIGMGRLRWSCCSLLSTRMSVTVIFNVGIITGFGHTVVGSIVVANTVAGFVSYSSTRQLTSFLYSSQPTLAPYWTHSTPKDYCCFQHSLINLCKYWY